MDLRDHRVPRELLEHRVPRVHRALKDLPGRLVPNRRRAQLVSPELRGALVYLELQDLLGVRDK